MSGQDFYPLSLKTVPDSSPFVCVNIDQDLFSHLLTKSGQPFESLRIMIVAGNGRIVSFSSSPWMSRTGFGALGEI